MKFTEYKALELTKIAEEILQFWKDISEKYGLPQWEGAFYFL